MPDTLYNYLMGTAQIVLLYAGFTVFEKLRPAEARQPWQNTWFNIKYLFVFQAANLLFLPFVMALIVGNLREAFPNAFGLLHINHLFDGVWRLIAFFFVYDFFYYWFHRLLHEWGVLWPQHQVHHSEESLNVTTTLRHHFLEDLLRVGIIVLPMSMAFDLTPYSAGAVAFAIGLWPMFIHANVRLSLGPLTRVIAGPQVHRIHHSLEPKHWDKNYAAFFPLWDQLFGTFYNPHKGEYPKTGLASGEKVTTIMQAIILPFSIWFGGHKESAKQPSEKNQESGGADKDKVQDKDQEPGKAGGTRYVLASYLLALLLLLGFSEVVARWVFPLPPLANFNRINYSPTTITPEMRNQHHLMNSTISWVSEPDKAGSAMHLNLYGFRDQQWDVKDKQNRRVLLVGDSFVEGFMVADNETIPAVFSRQAKASGQELEVFNLGVGGTDLSDYLKLIQDAVPALNPDEIVLVFYANDFAGQAAFSSAQIRPEFEPLYRPFWLPRLAQVTRRLLQGEPVALAWKGPEKPFLAAVPDPSNPWTENGEYLATQVDPDIAEAMRRATFNPHSTNELAEYAHYFRQVVDVSEHLSFLSEYLAQHNVQLRIAYIPYPAQVSDYYIPFRHRFGSDEIESMSGPEYQVQAAHLAEVASRLSVPFLDLTPLVREREAAGERLYWDYDHHFRPKGYAFVAEALYDWSLQTEN
jgi:sterol desaturase/sphingolipid hydroxylase (fatty acid hydroxylase superfamily)/lysophospholipase L1-like esterase